MGRRQDRIQDMAANNGLTVDLLPGTPLVELWGGHRVLIEGHRGVLEYTQERILVATKAGNYCICGDHLEMIKMTQEQLVIQGCIHGVTLCRRS